jgi:hypothetical protein
MIIVVMVLTALIGAGLLSASLLLAAVGLYAPAAIMTAGGVAVLAIHFAIDDEESN